MRTGWEELKPPEGVKSLLLLGLRVPGGGDPAVPGSQAGWQREEGQCPEKACRTPCCTEGGPAFHPWGMSTWSLSGCARTQEAAQGQRLGGHVACPILSRAELVSHPGDRNPNTALICHLPLPTQALDQTWQACQKEGQQEDQGASRWRWG